MRVSNLTSCSGPREITRCAKCSCHSLCDEPVPPIDLGRDLSPLLLLLERVRLEPVQAINLGSDLIPLAFHVELLWLKPVSAINLLRDKIVGLGRLRLGRFGGLLLGDLLKVLIFALLPGSAILHEVLTEV